MQKLYKNIGLRSGETLTKGTQVSVRAIPGNDHVCIVNNGIRDIKLSYTSVFKMPSERCLMQGANDGICKTPIGKRVEPDGHDEYGYPSWLLILGLI